VCSTKAILLIFYGDDVEIKNITKSSFFLVLNMTEMVGGCMYSKHHANTLHVTLQALCYPYHSLLYFFLPGLPFFLSPVVLCPFISCQVMHSCKFFLPLHTFHPPLCYPSVFNSLVTLLLFAYGLSFTSHVATPIMENVQCRINV
jgi:hypothetical protein